MYLPRYVFADPPPTLLNRRPLSLHNNIQIINDCAIQSGVPGSGQDGGAAVLRGPMAGKVVTQL